MNPPSAFLASAVVLVPAISGCLGTGERSRVHVPYPSEGAIYVYAGEDGERLTLKVGGDATRWDAFLQPRRVHLVNWTLSNLSWSPDTFRFQQAVRADSGRIVQQVAACGSLKGEQGNLTCEDERALVSFGADGLVGGFGAGLFWGDALEPGKRDARIDPALAPAGGSLDIRIRGAGGQGCVTADLGRHSTSVGGVRPFALTVTNGTIVLCDGRSFPVSFEMVSGARFRLVDVETASEGAWSPDHRGEAPEPGSGPVPLVRWRPPLLVADPSDPTPFPVREAHTEAIDRSDDYQRAFERQGTLLIGTHVRRTSNASVAPLAPAQLGFHAAEATTVQRELSAITQENRTVTVRLEKTTYAGSATRYRLLDESAGNTSHSITTESLRSKMASVGEAVELAKELTGHPRQEEAGLEIRTSLPTGPWFAGTSRTRSDGYTIRTWHEDPSPRGREGGVHVEIPYEAAIDGPTGGVIYLHVDRSQLPLHQYRSVGG